MEQLGEINDRQVFYIKVGEGDGWLDELPSSNWLVAPIADEKNIEAFSKLAEKCIDRNLIYMCGLGQCCEAFDDIFDRTVLMKKIQNGERIDSPDDFEDAPMTTWHHNFAGGFWFAVTYDGDKLIDKVACIDYTTKGVKKYLIELLNKFHQEWLPSEEEIQLPKYDS